MYNFKRIMVGLDLSPMDETLIKYTAFLTYYFRPEKIYFVNVQPDLDIPDEIREAFPGFERPRDETIKEEIEAKVVQHFPNSKDFDIECEVIEGSARKEILRWTHVKNIDLLIAGRKQDLTGSGMVPKQLARKVSCSVLFAPEKVEMALKHVLVPVDFSEYCQMALEHAQLLKEVDADIHVDLQHAYEVPMGYSKTGKSESEFAMIMEKHARKRMDEFLGKLAGNKAGLDPIYSYNKDHLSPADLIYEVAHARNADMIVIGARGRTAITALFLGSVAEKLIDQDSDIPLLIVKQKSKTFSFWEMISQI